MHVSEAESIEADADNDAFCAKTDQTQIRKLNAFHLRLLVELAVPKPARVNDFETGPHGI
jgi:hypothetical protein